MSYCQRCGELGRFDKCQKCGTRFILCATTTSIGSLLKRKHPISPIICESPKEENRLCIQCHLPLSGKIAQIPDTAEYHWSCLQCHECHQPFQSTSVYLDTNQQIYHTECLDVPPKEEKSCVQCKLVILDRYLTIGTSLFHPTCFQCKACDQVLTPASIYCYKDQNQVYCSPCHQIQFPQDQYTITSNVQWQIVPQPHSPPPCFGIKLLTFYDDQLRADKQSSQRPRFGMVKFCPGCQKRIESVHDEYKGPRAVSWHRQCLVCSTCRKQLDSSAKTLLSPKSHRLLLSCTTCLLQKKREVAV